MTTPALPTSPGARIVSIDVLRGVAVLGILLLNIRTFALPSPCYQNPSIQGVRGVADEFAFMVIQMLGDMKFMAIFSMLFGAGVVIFCDRLESRSGGSAGVWYRRLGWLLVIGLCHAWLLWHGDILVTYALCGMLVYLARHWRPRTQILAAAGLLTFGSLIWWGMGAAIRLGGEEVIAEVADAWAPSAAALKAEDAAWSGSWIDQTPMRLGLAIGLETFGFAFWLLWRVGGLMLLGMALYRSGLLDAQRRSPAATTCLIFGFGLGIPLTATGYLANASDGWQGVDTMFANSLWNYWGSVGVALGWTGLVMLLCRAAWFAKAGKILAAVGRMAMTNYLAQSILCAVFFYGWGFGWYGHLGYAGQLVVVAVIWTAQLVWSVWWLKVFRFGPAEWVWSSLTYLRVQSWRQVH